MVSAASMIPTSRAESALIEQRARVAVEWVTRAALERRAALASERCPLGVFDRIG